jgi:hypothetical protein
MRVLVEPVKFIRPGKAQVFLRPEANVLLASAIEIYGKPIYPTGSGSAGRTYEQQDFYWQRFLRDGSPVASPPDRGPRPHMRFGALDIDDKGAHGAMLRAGWIATTPSEWWHFEHPDCRKWPIVTDPYVATATLNRKNRTVTAFYCTKTDKPSISSAPQPVQAWGVGGDSPGTTANWYETTDPAEARALAAQHGASGNNWVHLTRAGFAKMRDRYLEPLKWAGGGSVDLSPVMSKLDAVQADVNKPRTLT